MVTLLELKSWSTIALALFKYGITQVVYEPKKEIVNPNYEDSIKPRVFQQAFQ